MENIGGSDAVSFLLQQTPRRWEHSLLSLQGELSHDCLLLCYLLWGRSFATGLTYALQGVQQWPNAFFPNLQAGSWPCSTVTGSCTSVMYLCTQGCVQDCFFSPSYSFLEEMDCAGTAPEAIFSLPGSQMHGHIAWLSLAGLGKLQQV